MPIPKREMRTTPRDDLLIQITDDGSLTLLKKGTRDSYHSGCGAVSETRHVYLDNSGVSHRLKSRRPTRVLEVGLGTGMGMLMTVDSAAANRCPLEFCSLEIDWVATEVHAALDPYDWVLDKAVVDSYLRFRSSLPERVASGTYRWQFSDQVFVDVIIQDVLRWMPDRGRRFDAVYFDPFCPDSAPSLWSRDCFSKLRGLIDDCGTLTTYSCSRPVRAALEEAGWSVERVPGPPGGKREVLVAKPQTS